MTERFAEGLAALDINLSAAIIAKQLDFLNELLRWNQRINLTAIKDHQEGIEKHLLDSLVVLKYLKLPGNLLDMGSGAGLPGIPLAIAEPQIQVVSVDGVGKKINFQKHVKRFLHLNNLTPVQIRLEHMAADISPDQKFDQVVARAFASLTTIMTLAAPCLKPGGRLLVMKGPEGKAELSAAQPTMKTRGFTLVAGYDFLLPFSGAERQMLVFNKMSI